MNHLPTLTTANFATHFQKFETEYKKQLLVDEPFSEELVFIFNWLFSYSQGKKTPAISSRNRKLKGYGERRDQC
jgi:hypothetical protein